MTGVGFYPEEMTGGAMTLRVIATQCDEPSSVVSPCLGVTRVSRWSSA